MDVLTQMWQCRDTAIDVYTTKGVLVQRHCHIHSAIELAMPLDYYVMAELTNNSIISRELIDKKKSTSCLYTVS